MKRIQEKITELSKKPSNNADTIAVLRMCQARIEQLEAHNEALMEASWEMKEGVPDAYYKIKSIRNQTPAQCLAEVRAQAGKEGYLQGIDDWIEAERNHIDFSSVKKANEYANQIRRQARK